MLSTVYRPQNRLRRKRSHCGPVAGRRQLLGRVMRKQICCGIELFARRQRLLGLRRTPRIRSANWSQNDAAADDLVVELVFGEKMRVEKMAKRPMAHVVQQGRHPQQRLDVAAAGHVRADLAQAVVGRLDHAAGQVHHAQHMLKAGVLGRGIDPPGGLQLVDLPQPLDPGMVDDRCSATSPSGSPCGEMKGM